MIFCQTSSFHRLARVTARIRRIIMKEVPKTKALLVREIEKEKWFWIKLAQASAFRLEIKSLKEKQPLPSKIKLLCLNPFLDKNGILRIGGRLREALIEYNSKHQMIIPKDSHLTKLTINDAHLKTKHGGTQLTTTYTRNKYMYSDNGTTFADPDDLTILTPGIGTNILAPPRPSLLDVNVNRLSYWNQISQRVEHFTKRWKAKYLSRLQSRTKWMRHNENVKIGDLVTNYHRRVEVVVGSSN